MGSERRYWADTGIYSLLTMPGRNVWDGCELLIPHPLATPRTVSSRISVHITGTYLSRTPRVTNSNGGGGDGVSVDSHSMLKKCWASNKILNSCFYFQVTIIFKISWPDQLAYRSSQERLGSDNLFHINYRVSQNAHKCFLTIQIYIWLAWVTRRCPVWFKWGF